MEKKLSCVLTHCEESYHPFATHEDGTAVLTSKLLDFDIMEDGRKVGYYQVYEVYDIDNEEETLSLAYLATICIYDEYQGKGRGTAILKSLVAKYGEVWLCAENDRCKSLYERLGEEKTENTYPEELQGNVDECGNIFLLN